MWKNILEIVRLFTRDGKHNHGLFALALICMTLVTAIVLAGAKAKDAFAGSGAIAARLAH